MLSSLITFIVIIVTIMIILDYFSIINYSRPKTEKFLSGIFTKNSFDKTNKINSYRTSTDPYDNNFYENTEGCINPMNKHMCSIDLIKNKN
jgi:hypothetical protein